MYNILLLVTLFLLFPALQLQFIDENCMVHTCNSIAMDGLITKIVKIFFQIVTDDFDFCKVAKS
jgi:hypothetical protein